MYFKRLEMTGFKSFVDYTCFDFESGISAVVGPNGCGKSNVVDSLRWVLGEQSARALRGARMEDVIFNGTDQRKALGMAEVSLTIDNHDHLLSTEHDEVTITRRTYRSGESEYLMNKVPCRMRDIHDLISGTGIGTNAYSFLEQGKIDLIVSSKAADRRFVFEEAAGISKYKSRKEESLRKLEATEQNFLRVNDIAVEVKRQIGTLERQAQKARRYQELKQELTTLEVSRGRRELRERSQALRKLEHAWNELCQRLLEDEGRKEAIEDESNSFTQEQAETERQLSQAQNELHRILEEIVKAEEFIASSELRRQDLQLGIERGEHELAEWCAKESQLSRNAEEIFSAQKEKTVELKNHQDALAEAEERLSLLEDEMKERAIRVQNQQNQLLQLVDQMSALRGNLRNLETRRFEHEQRLGQMDIRLAALQSQRDETDKEKQALDADCRSIQDAITALEAEKCALNEEKDNLENTLGTLDTMVDNFTKTVTQMTSRLHWIQELKNGLDGYESGAKAVLLEHNANPERFPGIIGPVANFLRAEREVEFAFESLLGHKLQFILVQTLAQAEEAMAYLAEGNRGRATFIPLECCPASAAEAPDAMKPSWMNLPGILGRARDLAKIDERFRAVFNTLFGDAVIVADASAAKAARASGAACTLVTLSGEIDSAERWLTGGSADISERGLLGREREIEELEAELEVLQRNLTASEGEAATLRTRLAEIHGGLSANNAELHELQIRAAKLDKSLERIAGQYAEVDKQIAAVSQERAEIEAARDKISADFQAETANLAELEECDRRTQEELALHQAEIEDRQQEYDEHTQRAGELRIASASLSQQMNGLEAEAERILNEIAEIQERVREKRAAAAADQERIRDLETQTRQRQDILDRMAGEKDAQKQAVDSWQSRKQELLDKKEHYLHELRRMQHALDELRKDQHKLELEKKQMEYALKSLEEYLRTEYQLNLTAEEVPADTAGQIPDAAGETADAGAQSEAPAAEMPVDPAVAEARIREIKEKLASMGSVNLVAMEEYNELEQRYEFLNKQLADLKEAKENLQRLITKINGESRARFQETFTQVREKFREVFRRLFNGGDAELVLVDENNLLDTGIEIIARPPGKRLQNISLLSGGEKALTAIALLFAIYLIKPSPFCIFDEMDAPLDDNNTLRFGRILKEFANKSQFIVITHNKITMETADVLYGITMQEPGVSRLVSARFKGEEKAHPVAPVQRQEIEEEAVVS